MRVLILGDVNSVHIRKWCLGLSKRGAVIGIYSLTELDVNWLKNESDIELLGHGAIKDGATFRKKVISKLQYLKVLPAIKRAIKAFKPDVLHAHYATSYGLLGSLTGFHPFYISVWGNDVFDFPNKNAVQLITLKSNLKNADRIFSTSHVMARETEKYTDKPIDVIPFGVDLNKFQTTKTDSGGNSNSVVIGTIKTLEPDYAIDVLIKSFALLYERISSIDLSLVICGDGSLKHDLMDLASKLGIDHVTTFAGYIDHSQVPSYLDKIDIFCCLSDEESFGVAVVEAMAMGIPVVVSEAAGLPEVVDGGSCGAVVPIQNPEKAADEIEKLVEDSDFRQDMGIKARARAYQEYDWNDSVSKMLEAYEKK